MAKAKQTAEETASSVTAPAPSPAPAAQASTITQTFNASGNSNSQINQGNVTNPVANIYVNEQGDAIIDQILAALQQHAAVNNIELDVDEVDKIGSELQTVYDNPEPVEEEVVGVVDRFKAFVNSYSERLLPMIAKSTLGLLSTTAAATGHPLLAMLLTVMQDAVPSD